MSRTVTWRLRECGGVDRGRADRDGDRADGALQAPIGPGEPARGDRKREVRRSACLPPPDCGLAGDRRTCRRPAPHGQAPPTSVHAPSRTRPIRREREALTISCPGRSAAPHKRVHARLRHARKRVHARLRRAMGRYTAEPRHKIAKTTPCKVEWAPARSARAACVRPAPHLPVKCRDREGKKAVARPPFSCPPLVTGCPLGVLQQIITRFRSSTSKGNPFDCALAHAVRSERWALGSSPCWKLSLRSSAL